MGQAQSVGAAGNHEIESLPGQQYNNALYTDTSSSYNFLSSGFPILSLRPSRNLPGLLAAFWGSPAQGKRSPAQGKPVGALSKAPKSVRVSKTPDKND